MFDRLHSRIAREKRWKTIDRVLADFSAAFTVCVVLAMAFAIASLLWGPR